MFFSGRRKREEARSALSQLEALMRSVHQAGLDTRLQAILAALAARTPDAAALWRDYEERAVFYNGLLIEVGELAPDVEAGQGFIPADIARRVHRYPLDLSLMRVSLRGYQAFGAKFALCQERAMLGDEMGLGKSVEALAAMCHLHVEGHRHFLVVCPASVLVNWTHEISRHSELRSHRLHGPDRQQNLQRVGTHRRYRRDHLRLPEVAAQAPRGRPRHAGGRPMPILELCRGARSVRRMLLALGFGMGGAGAASRHSSVSGLRLLLSEQGAPGMEAGHDRTVPEAGQDGTLHRGISCLAGGSGLCRGHDREHAGEGRGSGSLDGRLRHGPG